MLAPVRTECCAGTLSIVVRNKCVRGAGVTRCELFRGLASRSTPTTTAWRALAALMLGVAISLHTNLSQMKAKPLSLQT